ncbi:ABC transporter ATP-binding protein [Halalkalibacter kiskunsagensis]|uniref:ABC transporter ATP-binding protein n=1 Tax=Halalkalibacter kiskunsagensis TaxID=1548599 RepID=A0ABV6KG75_9BACI
MSLLELCYVSKEYPLRASRKTWFKTNPSVKVVKDVNLTINKGECLALIGESGSGKSTLAKLIMKLETVTSGQILLDGQMINGKQVTDLTIYKRIQLVLQDSSTSLHPKMHVEEILKEPIHNYFPEQMVEWEEMFLKLLKLVGLDHSYLSRYSHQLSGGQKQRVCIAKALAVQPDLIIFDESIASLDRDSQASIVNMLKHIQKKEQISYLFITHDLQAAQTLCDQVAVMYQGEIVETFSNWDLRQLKHPYTRSLVHILNKNSFEEKTV